MQITEQHLAEKRLNRLSSLALYHQSAWMFGLAALMAFKPHYIKEAGQCLGLAALLASFIASRIYIEAGKKVEEYKRFSPEEGEERKKEYLYKFFCPYFLWVGCGIFFSNYF